MTVDSSDATQWSNKCTPELTSLGLLKGPLVSAELSSLAEPLNSAAEGLSEWLRWIFCRSPVLLNTGLVQRPWLCSVCPCSVSENTGLLLVAGLSEGGGFLERSVFPGNTGLLGRQDEDLTEEVKLSWEESVNPELQTLAWGLQELGGFSCWVFLPNTGLLKYSGLSSVSSLSPWSVSEKTELLGNVLDEVRWLGHLGKVGLLGRASEGLRGEVPLSWEHNTNPEVLQVCSRSWLSRGTWTSALWPVKGKTGDLRSWQSSIWVESELWFIVERKQINTWSFIWSLCLCHL